MLRLFGLGLLLGGELVALVTGVLGAIAQQLVPRAVLLVVFGVTAAVVAVREFGLVSVRPPQRRRLVPERVGSLGEMGALQFGFELGTGMRTYSPSALPHLAVIALLTVVSLPGALIVGAGFALGRLAMPLLSNTYSDDGAWSGLWHRAAPLTVPLLTVIMIGSLAGSVVLQAAP